ncbi:MAG: hypothetical protein ACRDNK_24000 [Solirubrobacteraceae bacterium]
MTGPATWQVVDRLNPWYGRIGSQALSLVVAHSAPVLAGGFVRRNLGRCRLDVQKDAADWTERLVSNIAVTCLGPKPGTPRAGQSPVTRQTPAPFELATVFHPDRVFIVVRIKRDLPERVFDGVTAQRGARRVGGDDLELWFTVWR